MSVKLSNITDTVVRETTRQFHQRGLEWVSVGWDDCTRAAFSSIGPNISDWSFRLQGGTNLKFLRSPNYTDKTATLPANDISIVIGNERVDGNLRAVTFQNYLENYGQYTPGVPDETNLSSGPDELVTIRFIAVIVPEDHHGTCEVVPTAYSYQTTDEDDPKNIIGASFHLGVGSRTDGPGCESVYLVKTSPDGSHDNAWFRVTNENRETEEQREAVATTLGTRSTGTGRNRVQCFQIPRLQDRKPSVRGAGAAAACGGLAKCCATEEVYRSLSVGNVSYGSSAGKHQMKSNMSYQRDTSQNVTITYAYYFTTPDGKLSDDDIDNIANTLDRSYQDTKAEWVGSLVTGEADGSFKGKSTKPPIQLPNITNQDYLTFNQKVTHFPKQTSDVSVFPY